MMTARWAHWLAFYTSCLLFLGVSLPSFALSIRLSKSLPKVDEVVLVKVGGSAITQKEHKETLNDGQVKWVSETLADAIASQYKSTTTTTTTSACSDSPRIALVVIHGAGSFGHHQAKKFGLSGKAVPASTDNDVVSVNRTVMEGVARTRLSVQTLNRILVQAFLDVGLNAVGISPCFAIPSLRADGSSSTATTELRVLVADTLKAGLVPVIHGDCCLYGSKSAGILSGDTLFQILGPVVDRGVFWTDVDGVYTADPKVHPTATQVPLLGIDETSSSVVSIDASGSLHPQDVTGGFVTKLAAALHVARSGTNVSIARCGADSAKHALQQGGAHTGSTLIFRQG